VIDLLRAYVARLSQVDVVRVTALLDELLDEATKELAPANLRPDQLTVERYAQMCYPGQNFDMSVPLEQASLDSSGLLDLAERFHDQHQSDRGFSFRSQEPLLRGVRVAMRGVTPKPAKLAPPIGESLVGKKEPRPVYFGTEFVDTPVYDGLLQDTGTRIEGPALIEEPFTVVVVAPGTEAVVDDDGNYRVTVG
jgi:N-methylhydantoinase A